MKTFKQILFLWFVLVGVVLAQHSAFAVDLDKIADDARPAVEERVEKFRDQLESRSKNLLESQLGGSRFGVAVTVEFNEDKFLKEAALGGSKIRLRSLPTELGTSDMQIQLAETLTVGNIRKFVSKISLAVTVEEGVSAGQLSLIAGTLSNALKIPQASIKIRKEKLQSSTVTEKMQQTQESSAKLEKEVTSLEQQKSQIELKSKLDNQSLQQEKAKLELALRSAEARNKASEDALLETKKSLAQLEEEVSIYKTPLGDIKKIIKGLEVPLMVLPFALVALLVSLVFFVLINSISRKKSEKLFEGIELVSQALGKVGGKVGQSAGASSASSALQLTTSRQQDNTALAQSRNHSAPLLPEELTTLKKEAEESWKRCLEFEYLSYCEMKEWVASGTDGQTRLLTLMAILPAAESTRVVTKFSHEDINSLRGIYLDASQRLTGYSICHGLARTVMMAALSAPPLLKTLTNFAAVRASDRQYAEFLLGLEPEVCAVGLSVLPSARFGRVVEIMANLDPDLHLEGVFAHMVTALNETNAVENLEKALKELDATLTDQSKGVRGLAADLLLGNMESVSPKLRNQMLQAIQKDSGLALEANLRALSIEALLDVGDDVIRELVENYETEDLAKLMTCVSQDLVERLSSTLSVKLKSSVSGELQRLRSSELLEKRAQISGLAIQNQIVSALREMVAQGLVTSPSSLRGAPVSRPPTALEKGSTRRLEEGKRNGDAAETHSGPPSLLEDEDAPSSLPERRVS